MPVSTNILSNSNRPNPNDATLKKLVSSLGSLYYEVVQMEEALRLWKLFTAKRGLSREDTIGLNQAIECFLLHFRNLRDFFYPSESVWRDPKWFDNAIAWDFSKEWTYVSQDWVEIATNERDRINKLLTHVSYDRPNLDHDWSMMPQMQAAILRNLTDLDHLLVPERQRWFDELLRPPKV